MDKPTHYMVLGVAPGDGERAIRAAYRDSVRRLHPGAVGESSTGFRDATEAYEVLADSRRREAYDHELERDAFGDTVASAPLGSPEPMWHQTASLLGNPERIRPSFAAMRQRFWRNFSGLHVPKAERLEGLNFEVLLTREEAVMGCVVPVGIPVFMRCPRCDGAGYVWSFPCAYCQQQGLLASERQLRIEVPPWVRSGTVYELPLDGLGIHNFYLRVHVFVDY